MGLDIEVSGDIMIHNPPKGLVDSCLRSLRIDNPTYHVAVRKNPRARFALSEYIYYATYDERTDTLRLPRAVLDRVLRWCDGTKTSYAVRDGRVTLSAPSRSDIRLRSYQSDTLDVARRSDGGIFHLSTGFGKTIISLRLAELLQQRTLIIVPKQDLVNQFKTEFERYFKDQKIGLIKGNKVSLEAITVATVQTLKNRIKDRSLRPDDFGCVMIDECHQFVTAQARKVIEFFHAKYRYGFTGTMGRSDGQIQAIEWIIGPVIAKGEVPRAKPSIEIHTYDRRIMMDEYHNIIAEQTQHRSRNQLIYEIATQKRAEGRRVLILTKRVAHAEAIASAFESAAGYYIFQSTDAKSVRSEYLNRAKSDPDSIHILLGTYALLGTGIDIPGLDTLVLAGDIKSDVLLEQSAGRILRLFDNKKSPVIIDIHDTGNAILKRQGKIRQQFYEAQGWNVQHFTTQQLQLT